MEALTTALTTAVTTISGDAVAGIASIVPVAAPVFGGLLLIRVAMKATKRFIG